MSSVDFQAHTGLSGASGTPLSASEGFRELYQERLVLFAKIAVAFVAANWALLTAVGLASGAGLSFVVRAEGAVALVNCALSLAVWALCRRRARPLAALRALDAAFLVIACAVLSCRPLFERSLPYLPIVAGKGVTFAVMTRAVLIPGSAARTLAVSIAGYLPLFAVAFVVWYGADAAFETGEHPSLAQFVVNGLLGATLATVVSSVIFRLRRQVEKAKQLGQYRLEEKVGTGGMGEVFRASHTMLRRPTAIKLLRPDKAGEENLARFEREVQLTSELTHPNTVSIYDYGRTPDGTLYYAMEFLDGLNLEELVRDHGPQPPARVVHILEQVSSSLVEAHARGLIHRDIKPPNVILCVRGGLHDFVKLVDFGLVKHVAADADAAVTASDAITGTPLYMSPEAIRTPDRLDARSDIYAVGAVGYFLLAGKHLFDSRSAIEVCSLQLKSMPEPPSVRLGKPLPEDLEALVLRALAKSPEERPQSAAELLEALRHSADHGKWGEEEARAWWDAHRGPGERAGPGSAETLAAGPAARRAGASPSVPPSVTVDLGARLAE
jgi:serine/threonine-protein kinase